MERPNSHTVELHEGGMDCAGCARKVQQTVAEVPGVESDDARLAPPFARKHSGARIQRRGR